MFSLTDAQLDGLLADDVPYGDLTCLALGLDRQPGRLTMAARGAMVLCCAEEAVRLLERCGCAVETQARSGDALPAGALFLQARGPAGGLLRGWKVAQTLVEYASGMATATRALVEAACSSGHSPAVACTRKTVPGAKAVCIKAILAGGAVPHRLGLSESLLLFPEHRAFLDHASDDDLAALVRRMRAHSPEKMTVAEVTSPIEAVRLARAGVQVIQTEKFLPEQVRETKLALSALDPVPLLAAAGGITARNAAAYAAAGADVLVTSSPYQAPPADVQVVIRPES